MLLQNIYSVNKKTKINCVCDLCGSEYSRTRGLIFKSRKKHNNADLCFSCSCKQTIKNKPQCNKGYYTDEKKKELSLKIKNSDSFKKSLLNRIWCFGEKNGMFGKQHSFDTKNKMIANQVYRFGVNAPNWKGGKHSINKLVKAMMERKYKWVTNILKRDNFTCMYCGIDGVKLDVHHKTPMAEITKKILSGCKISFENNFKTAEWLIEQPEVKDADGITLCRPCHMNEHISWGNNKNVAVKTKP